MEDGSVRRDEATKTRKITITISGFESEEMARKALKQLLHPQLREEVLETAAKFSGDRVEAETILCCMADGNTYWCTTNGGICWDYCKGCIA